MLIDCIIYFMYIGLILFLMDWPLVVSIVSLIASFCAGIVALIALYLQIKSNEDLKRIKKNINKMEDNVKKISEVQNRLSFLSERNRLLERLNHPEYRKGIQSIFNLYDGDTAIIVVKINKEEYLCKVTFIKHNTSKYAFPKGFYESEFLTSFCVHLTDCMVDWTNGFRVIVKNKKYIPTHEQLIIDTTKIEIISLLEKRHELFDTAFYFSYNRGRDVWCLSEKIPLGIQGSQYYETPFISSASSFKIPPKANDFCKDC